TSASCSGLEASPGGDLCSRCPAASSAVADDAGPADIERATPHPREAPGHDSWPEPSKAKPPPLNDVEVYPGASKDLRPKFGSQYHKVPRIHGFVSTGIISMVGSSVSEDLLVLRVSEDLLVIRVSEDLLVLRVSEDLLVIRVSEDLRPTPLQCIWPEMKPSPSDVLAEHRTIAVSRHQSPFDAP
ncbi:hypothetical protein CYMTET_15851, partial [Cymbomonas tetramitiformis]